MAIDLQELTARELKVVRKSHPINGSKAKEALQKIYETYPDQAMLFEIDDMLDFVPKTNFSLPGDTHYRPGYTARISGINTSMVNLTLLDECILKPKGTLGFPYDRIRSVLYTLREGDKIIDLKHERFER
jgi:hypothetical protein